MVLINREMSTILFIIPYFGHWPPWIELYIHTLKRNSTINFLFITDCNIDVFEDIPNIEIQQSSFKDYINRYKEILGNEIQIPNPYKICDLRPFYCTVHKKDIEGFDFYGWTDMD